MIGPAGKCQIDAVATYILAIHEFASVEGGCRPLLMGWDALAAYLSGSAKWRKPHLLPFALHPHVATARRLMPTVVGM